MNRNVVSVLALAVALAATPLLAGVTDAQGGSGDHGQGHQGTNAGKANQSAKMAGMAGMKGQADMDERHLGNLTAAKQAKGFQHAEKAKLFSRFNQTGSEVTGRYVSFSTPGPGQLLNYRLSDNGTNTTLLSAVRIEGLQNPQSKVTGAVWRLTAGNAMVTVHNNPTASLNVKGGENFTGRVTFELAAEATYNANATAVKQNGLTVTMGANHFHIVPHGNATVNGTGRVITAELRGGDGVSFMYHPKGSKMMADTLHDLNKAVARGKAGAVVSVVNADGTPLQAVQSYGVKVATKSVQTNGASFTVASDAPEGKVIVLNLDPSILNVTSADRVKVRLDGADVPAVGAAVAKPFEAVINATSALVKTHVVPGQGSQVWVYVPSFSEHTITVQSTDGTGGNNTGGNGGGNNGGTQTGTPGFPVALGLLAVAAAGLVLRRRA